MKKEFRKILRSDIIWTVTKQGGFQRARIYTSNASEKRKGDFRKLLKNFLYDKVFLAYLNKEVSERELYALINLLVKQSSNLFPDILKNRTFRFGNAQKFVNLYLKSMWVMGLSKTPPHFPIDRVIQLQLPGSPIPWTNMSKEQYRIVINKAIKHMNSNSKYATMADWEANEYQLSRKD